MTDSIEDRIKKAREKPCEVCGKVFRKKSATIAALILPALAACGRPGPEPFRLTAFLQDGRDDVLLNSELIWTFNEPVDPGSVQGGGIRIYEGDGTPARPRDRGRFMSLPGGRVKFVPKLGSLPDLSDGGLQPGKRYRVVVDGFPKASGVRSASGRVLDAGATFSFATADPAKLEGRSPFEDPSPTHGATLWPESREGTAVSSAPPEVRLEVGRPLFLASDEPLRPDSVRRDRFTVTQLDRQGTARRVELAEPHLSNFEPQSSSEPLGARIVLRFKAPLDPDSVATVEIDDRLTDLGGNPCIGPFARSFTLIPIAASPPAGAGGADLVEEFLSPAGIERREPADGAAASATWPGDGRLTIHLPRAAGDGSDGVLRLSESGPVPRRLRATEIDVEPAAVLRAPPGTRLAALGAIRIRGALEGSAGTDGIEPPDPADPASGFDLALIAGGDLTVEGRIASPGSILLAAGGSVRIGPGARVEASKLRIVSPATPELRGVLPQVREVERRPLPDAERVRPRAPLLYRATSEWISRPRGPIELESVGWTGNAGSASVRVLVRGARGDAVSPWTENPKEVPPSDRVQIRIELELAASAAETPLRLPIVDRVSLRPRG